MNFEQARAAALALLTAQGRVKNSELLAAVGGDPELLARVREDLIFDDLAKDKDGVGLIAVASAAVVAAETPTTKPRVFLSYGRRDASAFVDRLCVDLAAAGFDVWWDTREIRSGQDWQTEIVDGLRAAQVVVAVMTPHSVRTTRDRRSPDQVDSVCLGEIAFALFQPPPQPVVPVMAQTCEPPLAIFHLDCVDLRAWQDSDSQYRAGLQRLIEGIHAALRGEKRYRSWHHQLDPFDFASFLHAKRSDFCGRQWLFDKLDAWRAASGRERALLIKGDPGVGHRRRVGASQPRRASAGVSLVSASTTRLRVNKQCMPPSRYWLAKKPSANPSQPISNCSPSKHIRISRWSLVMVATDLTKNSKSKSDSGGPHCLRHLRTIWSRKTDVVVRVTASSMDATNSLASS